MRVNTTSFELTVSVACDVRLAATIADLVRCAAQNAGCDGASADAFVREVEGEVRASLDGHDSRTGMLAVTLRSRDGAVEVLVGGRTLTLDT